MRQTKTKSKSSKAILEDKRRAANSRAVLAGGRPKKMAVCEHCDHEFGAREMRKHTDAARRDGSAVGRDGKFVAAAAAAK